MKKRYVVLDIGAKEYLDNEKRLYRHMKKQGWTERELVSEFLLEFVAVFIDATTMHRYKVKRAIEFNNGREAFYNAMFIYDIVTGRLNVRYITIFEVN